MLLRDSCLSSFARTGVIAGDVDTASDATVELRLRSQFGGWELFRTLLYADGTRRVWLRRRASRAPRAGLTV